MAESKSAGSGDNDRRGHDRRLTCVVAEVETTDDSSLALIRNVSETGALLFTIRELEVDSVADLVIHTSSRPDARKIFARGAIVRRVPLDPSRTDLWRWEVGVRFVEPFDIDQEDLAAITRALQER